MRLTQSLSLCCLCLFQTNSLLGQGVASPDELFSKALILATAPSPSTGALLSEVELIGGSTAASATEVVINESGTDLARVSGYTRARHFVVRNEGSFMRYLSSCVYKVEPEILNSLLLPAAPVALPEVSTSFSFTISDTAMPVSVATSQSIGFSDYSFSVTLTEEGGGILYKYEGLPTDDGDSLSETLPPGTYSLSAELSAKPDEQAILERFFYLQLTVGEEPEDPPMLPAPGEFTHPDILTERTGGNRLVPRDSTLVSETDQGDGSTEIRFTTQVENLSGAGWKDVLVELADQPASSGIEVITALPPFDLAANSTASPLTGSEMVLTVPNDQVVGFSESLLDGSALKLSGNQQPVFIYPVRPIGPDDVPPDSPGQGTDGGFIVPEVPLVGSGGLLLEWNSFFKVPVFINISSDFPPLVTQQQGFDGLLPVLVRDVVLLGRGGFLAIPYEVDGQPYQVDLSLVMKHGQVVEHIEPEAHPDDVGVTQIPESRAQPFGVTGVFPSAIPFHFNEIEVSSGIQVSGSLGFEPEFIGVTLEMEDLAIQELTIQTKYEADCNLLLETEEAADNTAEPVAGQESTLLDLELFRLQLASGFEFAPRLVLTAGAVINAPTSLSLPITSGLAIDITAGVKDGEPYYEQEVMPLLPKVSDPGFYEAVSVEAKAYLDCEIKALIAGASGTLSSGPTLGVRAEAAAILQPLLDPWWEICGKVSAFAGVELLFAGVINIIDEEKTLHTWELFDFDAGGPLISGVTRSAAPDPSPGYSALGDDRTRWIRSLVSGIGGLAAGAPTFALDLAGTDDVVIGAGNPGIGMLARLTPQGNLVWNAKPDRLFPLAGVAEDDGGFTVLHNQRGSLTLARFEGSGALRWSQSFAGADGVLWFQSIDLTRRSNEAGESEYYVLGKVLPGTPSGFHSAVAKLDKEGALLWVKSYPLDPVTDEGTGAEPKKITLLADGNLLITGGTQANFDSLPMAIYNATQNGMVVKISPDDGAVQWTRIVAERHSMTYHAVAEADDGSLYLGGNSLGNVLDEMPAMLLTKLSAEGDLVESVLIGASPVADLVPHRGETEFDTIYDMTWVDQDLWICGQIGLFNSGSVGGLAEGASAFTAMVDEKFNVSRFCIHAGPGTESFRSIMSTADGLFLTGASFSFHPWPAGSSEGEASAPGSLLALAMPWEGRTRFHLASAGNSAATDISGIPAAGTYFVTPRVRAVSQYTLNSNQTLFPNLGVINTTYSLSTQPTITSSDLIMNPGISTIVQNLVDAEDFKALEFVPESLITDSETWLRWWQISADEDGDGDGIPGAVEFFYGTSPGMKDESPVAFEYLEGEMPEESIIRYSLPRAKAASAMIPAVFSTESLEFGSTPRVDVTPYTEPLDEERDLLFLELPATEEGNFYRLRLPE